MDVDRTLGSLMPYHPLTVLVTVTRQQSETFHADVALSVNVALHG
jgi:hypothetical protein